MGALKKGSEEATPPGCRVPLDDRGTLQPGRRGRRKRTEPSRKEGLTAASRPTVKAVAKLHSRRKSCNTKRMARREKKKGRERSYEQKSGRAG